MADVCLHTHEEPKRAVDPASCPGCFLPFNETKNAPLLLNCGDSYCATCAKQAQPITCPVCYKITTESADELKKNATLISMLPLFRLQKPAQEACTNCSKAAATLFCGACNALCQPCSAELHSHKALSSHSVVALSERGSLQAPMCVKHAGQNLVLYCPVDGDLICLVCKDFGEHKGHAGIMAITDAAKQKRDDLRAIREQATAAQKLERHTAAIDKSQDDLKRESGRARAELERYFEQMHGALHTRKAEMLRGINEQESKMNLAFDAQKFELTKACSTLQAVAEQADKVCQGNDTQILQAAPVVFPQVTVLSRPCFSAVEFSLFLPALQKQSAESKFLSCHDKVAIDLVEALAA